MKHVYVGILASHGEQYDAFKKVWLRNIEHTRNLGCKVKYDFYFIYGGESNDICTQSAYTDLYYNYPETVPNMLRKTLKFFEHIEVTVNRDENGKPKNERPDIFILRTNLSTLFNFEMYQDWLENVSNVMFFGGSIINGYQGESTIFSGTNMIMSRDVMQFVLRHQDRFSYNYNEDIELSYMVMLNIKQPAMKAIKLKAMKRLDFVSDKIIYHKCHLFSDDICCYRFKSNDRKTDANTMHNILACLQSGVNVTKFIQNQLKHMQVTSEKSGMAVLAKGMWVITRHGAQQTS